MDSVTITGIAASVFTGISMVPQLVTIIKKKTVKDISFGMLGVLFAGLALWIGYGILKHDPILIVANAFSLLINTMIIILSVRYK